MAHAVQKVVLACQEVSSAEDGGCLDLSSCQLIQVPDAVYFMMKQTDLSSINLSFNVITKLPPKFPLKFNQLTELNLSNNRLSNLPDEFEDCRELETVDISHNSFISLPFCFYSMKKLKEIKASKNFISDIDVDAARATGTLEIINVEDNPLSRPCLEILASKSQGQQLTIKFTSRELEEWEDLSL
eukprot:TRINITY_DN1987_c0_g1_i1.p1 TRINITY_DN1987_c0_g1~~TRINITY_DN1987_c0_g1_i1.p1  ORF type:complete len:186 (-),score=57.34 TRINITY_DN1987_c0_g1_i1:1351-1908(-)